MELRRAQASGSDIRSRQERPGNERAAFDIRPPRSPWRNAALLARQNPTAAAGLLVVLSLCTIAVVAPALAPYDPENLNPAGRLREPSAEHWFGTDSLGRDVLSLVMYGGRVSLPVGFGVASLSAICGTAIGLCGGYFRRLDMALFAVMDGFMAFPGLLLALVLISIEGPQVWAVILALAAVQTPRTARIIRSSVLTIRGTPYIEAARGVGAGHFRIMVRYILPNAIAPLVIQATASFAGAVLAEAALSFLGAGVDPTTPTWGNIIGQGRGVIQRAPWLSTFPGLAIALTVLSVSVVGDGLRDILDPTLPGQH